HDDSSWLTVFVDSFNPSQLFIKFDHTVKLRIDAGINRNVGGSTTYVEGPQGKLCTRFTDGLGCNNPHRFAFLYQRTGSQVSTITLGTNTSSGFTSKHRSDFDLFYRRFINLSRQIISDLLSG